MSSQKDTSPQQDTYLRGHQTTPCCATQPVPGTLPASGPHLPACLTGHSGPSQPDLGPACCRNPQPIIFDLADRLVYAMPRKQMLGESAEGIMAACEHSLAAANTITRLQTSEQQGAGPLQQQVMPCMPLVGGLRNPAWPTPVQLWPEAGRST